MALILGDNIFYGQGFQGMLQHVCGQDRGTTVFAYPVRDPALRRRRIRSQRDRPVDRGEAGPAQVSLRGHQLYFYDNQVLEIAAGLKPSPRGELEITDVDRAYPGRCRLSVEIFSHGFSWLDIGTTESLIQAANYVETIESRQGLKIACIEEVAYRMGFITADQVERLADKTPNEYGSYLEEIARDSAGPASSGPGSAATAVREG